MEKIRLIFDRRKKADKTEKGFVEILIRFDGGARKYVATNIECFPKEFKNRKFAGKSKDRLTAEAECEIGRYERAIVPFLSGFLN